METKTKKIKTSEVAGLVLFLTGWILIFYSYLGLSQVIGTNGMFATELGLLAVAAGFIIMLYTLICRGSVIGTLVLSYLGYSIVKKIHKS